MRYLVIVSFIWAFSFGLTKGRLAALDSAFISAARLGLALLVFLPFLRCRGLPAGLALRLAGIGALQFGVMYLALNESYRYLQAHEVVLFTIVTPILVTLFADALDRTLRVRALLAACIAVAGTALVAAHSAQWRPTLLGLALVQGSNAAFALGQVLYQRLRRRHATLRDRDVFAIVYGGAALVAMTAAVSRLGFVCVELSPGQVWTLLYLGVVASGLGFFLWNVGATRVSTGTLAVMNNAKAPLGVACSLVFFGERTANPWLLAASVVLMVAAVVVAEKKAAPR